MVDFKLLQGAFRRLEPDFQARVTVTRQSEKHGRVVSGMVAIEAIEAAIISGILNVFLVKEVKHMGKKPEAVIPTFNRHIVESVQIYQSIVRHLP
jgi:hypothetical protein